MNKKIIIALSFLFLVFFLTFKFGFLFSSRKLEFLADRVFKTCSSKSDRTGCYDTEIPKLLSKRFVTMEEAFQVTRIIQSHDKEYLYCHVLGHNLADVETKKDPSKWLDVVTRCPPLECNNGCAHGAIMRRFKGEETLLDTQIETIVPDLKIACEARGSWKPTEVEGFMCYHSMGHVLMYLTGGDIDRSLSLCKKIGVKEDGRDYYQTCTQGVFMIIFQGLDPEDLALVSKITPKKEEVVSFCKRFVGLENTACRTESWPLFFTEFEKPKGLVSFCSFTKTNYDKNWCYGTGLRGPLTLSLLNSSGVESVSNYCMGLPNDIRESCFATIATGWVQNEPRYIEDSINLCEEAEKFGLSKACYNDLLYYSRYGFEKDTQLWSDYCSSFSGENKDNCYSGNVPENVESFK